MAATAVAATAAIALWPTTRPGGDPALWPVETLTADPAVALPYVLHVTPADCPGLSLSSPVPEDSRNVPGSGSFTVDLGGSHYALAVCLGTVEETGGARRSVAEHIGADDVLEDAVVWNRNATLVDAPYGELVRVDRAYAATSPPRLTDWLVDHGGYTYAVGYLHPDDDTGRYRDVEAMLASVTWDQ
ncbi:hypothetical protein [Cellulomonas sp. Leaf334]|uniref:hypothetical protein n=1 Tax=Cellulomonas sp. Leaf334 TaxID=1736339 RepID=UPI0012E1B399|nr:hypothetical protein [Cellulomonas sp. Leaf334]